MKAVSGDKKRKICSFIDAATHLLIKGMLKRFGLCGILFVQVTKTS